MSKSPRPSARHPSARPTSATDPHAAFVPASLRIRHDGWTPARQVAFIQGLADTACVAEACARVGMSAAAAYRLRRHPQSQSFRAAWDAALEYSVNRLADAMLGRALNGVATPVFYKGEQIGERRRYDERLAMFILRYRQPERYGAWLDTMTARELHADGPAIRFTEALRRVAADGAADAAGQPRPAHPPLRSTVFADDPEHVAALEEAREAREQVERDAEFDAYLATLAAETANVASLPHGALGDPPPAPASDRDVA